MEMNFPSPVASLSVITGILTPVASETNLVRSAEATCSRPLEFSGMTILYSVAPLFTDIGHPQR